MQALLHFSLIEPDNACAFVNTLLTGVGQAHHGEILREVAALADSGKLKPLLNELQFSPAEIAEAHALVESGAVGKVVVEF
jgi:NADPH:quinone reductase